MGSRTEIAALLERCHLLGVDPRNTNYAGGNCSVKGKTTDPVSGADVEVLWVKGSGGDLGTLTESGLAVLRLDRLRELAESYRGEEREREMVAAIDYCLHGRGGAEPSVDTMMHALLPAAHVDHLHPDAGIALATATDGPELVRRCFGDRVAWVPWRRPGFPLALEVAKAQRRNPRAIGAVLGGHGITAWGEDSAECREHSLEIVEGAQALIDTYGRPNPFGDTRPDWRRLPDAMRRERAAALAPILRGLLSTSSRERTGRNRVGHFIDTEPVLDFLGRERMPELAARGACCPDHLLRTGIRPLVLDTRADAPLSEVTERARDLHAAYRRDHRARRHSLRGKAPAHGDDPSVVLVPGVGLFSFGQDKQAARVAGEYYVNAITVMRGAEALSEYRPVPEEELLRIEYSALEEAELRTAPTLKPLTGRVALVTAAGSEIGKATARRLTAEGACVVVADLDRRRAAEVVYEVSAHADRAEDVAVAVGADVSYTAAVDAAIAEACLAFGGVDLVVANNAGLPVAKPLAQTSDGDWDLQHRVLARGSFLVARAAARVMSEQGIGGDIVYISGKNGVVSARGTLAYGAAKADQAHQVRLLAAELGPLGIRVNGINPEVVLGPGTLLGAEVLPDHVAAAVFVLTGGDLPRSTGVHIPVDSGVPEAFLR